MYNACIDDTKGLQSITKLKCIFWQPFTLTFIPSGNSNVNLHVFVLCKDVYYFLLLFLIHVFNVLTANSNLTRLFEGEPGHLVPSASHFLVESDMFMVAGRMIGHSFLHGGPCLQGLSPAVVHVLLGGSPETATITLEDCPDLDIRETIRLVCLIKKCFFSVICCTMGYHFIVYPLSLISDFIAYCLQSWRGFHTVR